MPGFVLHSADKEVRLREDVASKRSIGVDQALDSQFSALSSALIHFSVSVIIGLVSENVMMRLRILIILFVALDHHSSSYVYFPTSTQPAYWSWTSSYSQVDGAVFFNFCMPAE